MTLEGIIRQEKTPYLFLALKGRGKFSYLVFAINQDRYVLYMNAGLGEDVKDTALFQLNQDLGITSISRPIKGSNILELEKGLKVTQFHSNEKLQDKLNAFLAT